MKIRDASGWTMFVFGVLACLLGLSGLIRPETILSLLGFDVIAPGLRAAGDYTLVFVTAAAMASFNIGVYYVIAALNDLKIFYRWTIAFRGVTFLVFSTLAISGIAPIRFIAVGIWEFVGATATWAALYSEGRAKPAVVKKAGRTRSDR